VGPQLQGVQHKRKAIFASLQLLNNCLTANKKYEIDYETVLANVGFNQGKHYWEIKLDTFIDMEDIFVGVASRNTNLYMRATDSGTFWGWICTGYLSFLTRVEVANSAQPPPHPFRPNMAAFQK